MGAWENGPMEAAIGSEGGTPAAKAWWRRPSVIAALLVATAFIALLTIAQAGNDGKAGVGEPAPVFAAPLLDGSGSLGTADLKGRPYVLNFWASWCDPCLDEAPMLEQAHKRFGKQVTFVGIDIKDTTNDARDFVDRFGLTYAQVRDETRAIEKDYGLTGQPESFFVDASGTIVEHVPGPLTEDTLDQLLNVLVARHG